MRDINKGSIVLLIGNSIMNKNTAVEFLNSGLPIKRIVICEKKSGGTLSFLKRSAKKYGYFRVFGQVIERIYYKIVNSSKDQKILSQLVNKQQIEASLLAHEAIVHHTENYENEQTLSLLKNDAPDLIVIHTPYWVGKKVRNIPPLGVIGGHPGITPDYRGIHSPFWAIYNKEPQKVGFTVFWVDAGVDTGDIIYQEKIVDTKGDSYITLSWKGMLEICKNQILIAKNILEGVETPRQKILSVEDDTNYPHPTIWQYLNFRRIQKTVR